MSHSKNKATKECLACTDHHEEFGLSRPNCGTRHGSSFQPRWLLHREGKMTHHSQTKKGPNVHLQFAQMELAMSAKGTKVDTHIELWHKRIVHINLDKLKGMQSKGVVVGLPTFKEKGIEGVCEACQFGKQHWHSFLKERNVSKGLLKYNPLRCVVTYLNNNIWRMLIICHIYRRLLQAHLDLPHKAKE